MKSYHTTLITVIFLLIPSATVASPEGIKSTRIRFEGGLAHLVMRDEGISQLLYSGTNTVLSTGVRSERSTYYNETRLNFQSGIIAPSVSLVNNESHLKLIKGEINYTHMRLVMRPGNSRARLSLGGTLNSEFTWYKHNKMTNSSDNTYFFSTINISGQLQHPVNIKETRLELSLKLIAPVMAFIIRPSYSYIKPEGFLDHTKGTFNSLISSIEVALLNRFPGIGSESLIRYDAGGYSVGLGYRWEYAGHLNINRLEYAQHRFLLQIGLNL